MPTLKAEDVQAVLRKGGSARMPDQLPPRFAVGEAVKTRNLQPLGHTRLPAYLRTRTGTIHRDCGVFIFPDAHAAGDRQPQRLYCVRFEGDELWGAAAARGNPVYADLFESYLEPLS